MSRDVMMTVHFVHVQPNTYHPPTPVSSFTIPKNSHIQLSLDTMFRFTLLALLALIVSTAAFAPSQGKFLVRSSALKMAVMPPPPKEDKSDKTVGETLTGAIADAVKGAGIDLSSGGPYTIFAPTDAAVSAFSGSITADVLKFHVSSNQQLPTRNGRTYVSLNDDKEVGIKVTVDTCESFAMHGVAPPAKMAKITGTTRCTNGYIHTVDAVLEPYEGKTPPSMFLKNTEDANLHN